MLEERAIQSVESEMMPCIKKSPPEVRQQCPLGDEASKFARFAGVA
jgi:hypothetical protein